MNQCSPVEMEKNLSLVDVLKDKGIDFVAIPVGGELTKDKLIQLLADQFNLLIEESKSN